MQEIRFFSSEKTNTIKKKLMGLIFSQQILFFLRGEKHKKYFLQKENKKMVSVGGYMYSIFFEEQNIEKIQKILIKELGESITFLS